MNANVIKPLERLIEATCRQVKSQQTNVICPNPVTTATFVQSHHQNPTTSEIKHTPKMASQGFLGEKKGLRLQQKQEPVKYLGT